MNEELIYKKIEEKIDEEAEKWEVSWEESAKEKNIESSLEKIKKHLEQLDDEDEKIKKHLEEEKWKIMTKRLLEKEWELISEKNAKNKLEEKVTSLETQLGTKQEKLKEDVKKEQRELRTEKDKVKGNSLPNELINSLENIFVEKSTGGGENSDKEKQYFLEDLLLLEETKIRCKDYFSDQEELKKTIEKIDKETSLKNLCETQKKLTNLRKELENINNAEKLVINYGKYAGWANTSISSGGFVGDSNEVYPMPGNLDWQNVHSSFTPELAQTWMGYNFNRFQVRRLAGALGSDFNPSDHEFINWLLNTKKENYASPELVLNNDNKVLREEFKRYRQNQEQQAQIVQQPR